MTRFRVSMKETEHDKTFETSFLIVNPRINPFIVLVRAEYPNTVRGKIYNVQIIGKCIYKAPPLLAWFDHYSPSCIATPPQKFPQPPLPLRKFPLILEGRDTMINMYIIYIRLLIFVYKKKIFHKNYGVI